MTNQQIFNLLKLHASLLELHGENNFKVRSYHTAVFNMEALTEPLSDMSLKELQELDGVGKAIATKIDDINQTSTFKQLEEYRAKTPEGLIDMMGIDGLGIKKIKVIWEELGIEDIEALLLACETDQLAQVKGFGQKTQENIKNSLLFRKANAQRLHYAQAETLAQQLKDYLQEKSLSGKFEVVGQIRRKLNLVDQVQVIATTPQEELFTALTNCEFLEQNLKNTGLYAWRGKFANSPLRVEARWCTANEFAGEVFIHSASPTHLEYAEAGMPTLYQIAREHKLPTEEAIYQKANLAYVVPEMREGDFELALAKTGKLPKLLEVSDLKGILHAHSTYSDGKNTLEEMALAVKNAGYEYLGITDHSQSAFYANGLPVGRVLDQIKEIDALNEKLAPFKIFKGMESDIIADGGLDYDNDILAKFDFIIASVHSGLKMAEEKATSRLIKAIENPYTTMLGHPTGRLLLRREGYPVNHKKIIDACAANNVSIEINASPWRLDIDWQWVHYAIEKGVKLSINPDSHEVGTIDHVYYGVCVGRKGGLTKEMTLNTLGVDTLGKYFADRKKQKGI
ncbi:DNA polymerase/3'-5' exonuclease PolX [uncultured Microscilla sp.]|uniref:DNA polymerase/3'-5' exonuclease PolX n=1 Tax=uncultured Microscilla sp. TaxID=432653 RepID=UPI00262698DC|nr:DNA polymerase/3'-5' exonuclease PolX [uncultured Microscilla sp.]